MVVMVEGGTDALSVCACCRVVFRWQVYQDLAFGSTRPRNMMPGHLCTNVDPSQTKRLAARTRRMRKIANLRRDADKKGNDVYKVKLAVEQNRQQGACLTCWRHCTLLCPHQLMGSLKSGRIDYLAGVQLHKFHAAIKHLEVRTQKGVKPNTSPLTHYLLSPSCCSTPMKACVPVTNVAH